LLLFGQGGETLEAAGLGSSREARAAAGGRQWPSKSNTFTVNGLRNCVNYPWQRPLKK
jgi:hypothetical protein